VGFVSISFAESANRAAAPTGVAPPVRRQWSFSDAGVTFDTRFDGSRLQECTAVGPAEFAAVVRPENTPINDSAWFAFKVSAKRPQTIKVRLKVEGGSLRYTPKISVDGLSWAVLPSE